MDETDDLLTCGEAAHRLRYSRTDTFRHWANRVGFPLVRVSRTKALVRRSDLEAEIRRREEATASILAALRGTPSASPARSRRTPIG